MSRWATALKYMLPKATDIRQTLFCLRIFQSLQAVKNVRNLAQDAVQFRSCGAGTIKNLKIDAVEIQENACTLAQKSVEHNGLCDNIKIINADLCDLKGKLNFGCYDVVVCNPPYKIGGGGIKNPTSARLIARHESECTLDDICSAASKLLQFGGRFYMCQRPERLGDVMESMRKFDIEPKTLRLVQQRVSKAPKLFLLEGRRGGKRGFLNVLPTLFIEDESGNFSKEMLEIYGSYKSDH